MRKLYLFSVMALLLLLMSACGGSSPTTADTPAGNAEATDKGKEGNSEKEPTQEPEPTKEPEPTEEPKEASYKPGDKFTLGKWEVVLDSFEFNQKVSDDMFSSSADEGSKFIILKYTVTNNGTEADDFTAMFNGVKMDVIFKDQYEYDYTITMIDGDLSKENIKPLASKSGFVVVEVPDAVSESTESLIVKLEEEGDKATITLR
ncbi:Telomeric repeat-binding factor 2 [compost metagenome]